MQPTVHRNGTVLDASSLDAAPPLSLDALDVTALSALTPLQLAALAQRLAALQSSVASAMFQHAITTLHNAKDATGNGSARMLSADEAATVLGKPRRWLFDNAKRLPFVRRISRKTLLCDPAGLHRWIASRPR